MNSFYRGKGEGGRLGHVAEDHMRHPKVIEAFSGKKIIDVAVGSVHCLAVTEDGEVYSWGRNEQGQLGDTSNIARTEPALIAALESKEITGVACGPAQVRFFFYICRLNYWAAHRWDICAIKLLYQNKSNATEKMLSIKKLLKRTM